MARRDPLHAIDLQHRRVVEALDRGFEDARSAPEGHPCARGCDACCYGPFDVGPADLWTLLEGILELDPEPRGRVLARIRSSSATQRRALGVAADSRPSLDNTDEDAFDAMCDTLDGEPCPLLEGGACLVYEHRPFPCRLRGAEWRDGDGTLDMPCPIGLTEGRATFDVDVAPVEEALDWLDLRLTLPGVDRARTTIALGLDAALRRRRATEDR